MFNKSDDVRSIRIGPTVCRPVDPEHRKRFLKAYRLTDEQFKEFADKVAAAIKKKQIEKVEEK